MKSGGYEIASLFAAILAVGCTAAPSGSLTPFGPEFAPIAELSPEYAARADGSFDFIDTAEDGEEFHMAFGGFDYRCAGRPQEYFEFADANPNGPPKLISNSEAAYRKQFNAENYPEEMLRTFADRSNASDQDAIKTMPKLEPNAWPPFGLADYIAYDDGWLIAYNIGEFGGALIWLPREGDSELIRNGATNDLLQVGEIVYVSQGADHISPGRGDLVAYRRTTKSVPDFTAGEPPKLITGKFWTPDGAEFFASAAIAKIAYRDGLLVGLTRFGLILVGEDGVVRYNAPAYREWEAVRSDGAVIRQKRYKMSDVIQRAQDIAIDEAGRIYVAGVDMMGVLEGGPSNLIPTIYAKKDCKFDYGLPDHASAN